MLADQVKKFQLVSIQESYDQGFRFVKELFYKRAFAGTPCSKNKETIR